MIGGVVNAHVAVKFIYVRMFRGTASMHTRSFTARAAWAAICATLWTLSWIIAEGIPIFNDVLGLAVCVLQASSVEPKDPWLMSATEFSLCQLVFFRSSGAILALFEPDQLGIVSQTVYPFLHQHGALAVSVHHCECLAC